MKCESMMRKGVFLCLCGAAAPVFATPRFVLLGEGTAAYGISGDGSTVVGIRSTGPSVVAETWTTAGGSRDLGYLLGDSASFALAASYDGSVVVGFSGSRPFRWTSAGGMKTL